MFFFCWVSRSCTDLVRANKALCDIVLISVRDSAEQAVSRSSPPADAPHLHVDACVAPHSDFIRTPW